MRSESRRNGLTCCGWCAARHASMNPSYLTEGYKSTGNNQTTGQNPTVHKGFSPYPAYVNKTLKVDIRIFRQEGFSLNEETWVRDIKEKRESYGISQQKLALAAGITRPYLSDIETGKAHPPEALQEAITEALERFNPDAPLEMLFDYVRIRFPTTDVKHIVEDVLRLKLPYFIHEDYGFYSYTEHYYLGDIFVLVSPELEKGVLLELKGRGCRQFESYLLAQERSWYDFLWMFSWRTA